MFATLPFLVRPEPEDVSQVTLLSLAALARLDLNLSVSGLELAGRMSEAWVIGVAGRWSCALCKSSSHSSSQIVFSESKMAVAAGSI